MDTKPLAPSFHRRSSRIALAGATFLLISVVVAARPQTNPARRAQIPAVTADGRAYMAAPTEIVAASDARGLFVCPTGRFVLISQNRVGPSRSLDNPPMPTEHAFLVYDSKTGATTALWRHAPDEIVNAVGWFEGTSIAIVSVTRPAADPKPLLRPLDPMEDLEPRLEGETVLVQASGAKLTALRGVDSLRDHIDMSPLAPFAIIRKSDAKPWEIPKPGGLSMLRVLKPDGSLSRGAALPADARGPFWSRDGKVAYYSRRERATRDPKTGAVVPPKDTRTFWFAFGADPGKDGAVETLDEKPTDLIGEKPEPETAVRAVQSQAALIDQLGDGQASPIWLLRHGKNPAGVFVRATAAPPKTPAAKPEPTARVASITKPVADPYERLLLAADADPNSVQMLPDASAVLFTKGGALYAIPILSMDQAAFEEKVVAAERQRVISNAKQIGLGIMMYAQDYDENFPLPGTVSDAVMPYVKNSDLFAGFVFSYSGPTALGMIDKPAETVLGHINGPGGRAVLYADGHVKWMGGG